MASLEQKIQVQIQKFEFDACLRDKVTGVPKCKLFKSDEILELSGEISRDFWFHSECGESINYPQSFFCSQGLMLDTKKNQIKFFDPKKPDDTVPG